MIESFLWTKFFQKQSEKVFKIFRKVEQASLEAFDLSKSV